MQVKKKTRGTTWNTKSVYFQDVFKKIAMDFNPQRK